MKRTLLLLTGVACLATSGVATVFANKTATSPGPETLRSQGGAITDMDEVGIKHYEGAGEPSETFERLDINQDNFLSAEELDAYGSAGAGDSEKGGYELVEEFDQNGDGVLSPVEFESPSSSQ